MSRKNNKLIQKIVSMILCIVLVLSLAQTDGLSNLFHQDITAIEETESSKNTESEIIESTEESAENNNSTEIDTEESSNATSPIDNKEDSDIKSWRETTAMRSLYTDINQDLIGKCWFTETITEILQMSEDPEIEFDEESFFEYNSYYNGLTLNDLKHLKNLGYDDLEMLTVEMDNKKISNIFDYIVFPNRIQMFSAVNAVSAPTPRASSGITASYWGNSNYLAIIPEINRGTPATSAAANDAQPKRWYYLSLKGQPAFCLDNGKPMPAGTTFSRVTVCGDTGWEGYVKKAVYWYYKMTGGSNNYGRQEEAQSFIWSEIERGGNPSIGAYANLWAEYSVSKSNQNIIYSLTRSAIKDKADLIMGGMFTECPLVKGPYNGIIDTVVPSEFIVYIYYPDGGDYQRLASWAVEPTVEKTDPVTPTADFRNRLYVKHNINGSVRDDGTGVVATWTPGTSTAGATYYEGGAFTSNVSHTTVDIPQYQINPYDENGNLTETWIDFVFNYNRQYKSPYTSVPHYSVTTVANEESLFHIKLGYERRDTAYVTYSNDYCNTTNSFNTHKPVVENYTLTLHYQGGYYDGNLSTSGMNTINYNNVNSFSVTRPEGLAVDGVSTEETKVSYSETKFKGSYVLNTPETGLVSGTASQYPAGTLNGTRWTPSENDGVAGLAHILYKNFYIVSLPTPKRTGYNFLGWYDSNGKKYTPQTVVARPGDQYSSQDAQTFTNAIVIDKNTTLYAHWELITKDETFTVKWLDNYNNYTTRPSAVYVELYRISGTNQAELCKEYITERFNDGPKGADWIDNYSNETGLNNNGNKDFPGAKDTIGIFDPNKKVYNYGNNTKVNNTGNNIFAANGSFWIKVDPTWFDNSGDYGNPATSNTWTFTLRDLQKYDTSKEPWTEYKYVVKQVVCESLDETVQYYTSPDSGTNSYTTPTSSYYMMANGVPTGGQMTLRAYNALNIKNNFSKTIVNRSMNVAGLGNWKNVTVSASFKDGPQNEGGLSGNQYNDDIYHFRPYELKVELYQNYAFGKDTNSDNYLTDNGVRVLYDTKFITQPANFLSSTLPAQGNMANTLRWTFANVPTLQDQTCIKIAYDAVLTHGQVRYRYTIDNGDKYNNFGSHMQSSHYYANKHETNMQTITDLNYLKMYSSSLNKYLTIVPTIYKEITPAQYNALSSIEKQKCQKISGSQNYLYPDYSKLPANKAYKADVRFLMRPDQGSYLFVDDNYNDIYQSFLEAEDYMLVTNGQNNRYNAPTQTAVKASYPNQYKSMAYNVRYYYITEDRYMRATPTYDVMPDTVEPSKQVEYLFYKETLYWNFELELNNPKTPLPEEYSGSASSDDRTGNYNGSYNDDYMHTNNTFTITSKVYADTKENNVLNQYGSLNSNRDWNYYENLKTEKGNESFLITLKQVEKTWPSFGYTTGESYNNNKYSINGYVTHTYSNNRLFRQFVSNPWNTTPTGNYIPANSEAVGNDYNIFLPAQGSVTVDYIPDGKYEINCHYDIDFSNFNYETSSGTVILSKERHTGKNEEHEVCAGCGYIKSGLTPYITEWECHECYTRNTNINSRYTDIYYLTFTSKDVDTITLLNHKAAIDLWRGYVNDKNTIPSYATSVKKTAVNPNRNGFNTSTNFDEKNPDSYSSRYEDKNYNTPF